MYVSLNLCRESVNIHRHLYTLQCCVICKCEKCFFIYLKGQNLIQVEFFFQQIKSGKVMQMVAKMCTVLYLRHYHQTGWGSLNPVYLLVMRSRSVWEKHLLLKCQIVICGHLLFHVTILLLEETENVSASFEFFAPCIKRYGSLQGTQGTPFSYRVPKINIYYFHWFKKCSKAPYLCLWGYTCRETRSLHQRFVGGGLCWWLCWSIIKQ